MNAYNQVMNLSERERGRGVKFDRLRRITGYLTTDTRSWSTAKQQEEHDRVKHSL